MNTPLSLNNERGHLVSNKCRQARDVISICFTMESTAEAIQKVSYLSWLDTFEEEVLISDEVLIPDIPDHGSVVLPKDCFPKQVAMQKPDDIIYPGVPRYEIDNNYWKLMNAEEKAALVLHELVYREAIATGHKNSIATRYFTCYIMNGVFEALEYFKIAFLLPFKYAEFFGSVAKNGEEKCRFGGACKWVPSLVRPNGFPAEAELTPELSREVKIPGLKCRGLRNSFRIGYSEKGNINLLHDLYCDGEDFEILLKDEKANRNWVGTTTGNSNPRIFHFGGFYSGEGRRMRIYEISFSSKDAHVELPPFVSYFGTFLFIKKFGFIFSSSDENINFTESSYFEINDRRFGNLGGFKSNSYGIVSSFWSNGKRWKFSESKESWITF